MRYGWSIDYLGDYFVNNKLREKEGITFEQFLAAVKRGRKIEVENEKQEVIVK